MTSEEGCQDAPSLCCCPSHWKLNFQNYRYCESPIHSALFPWGVLFRWISLPLRRRYGKGMTSFITLLCIQRWNVFLSSVSSAIRASWIGGNKEFCHPVTSSTPLKSDLNFCRLGRLSALDWPSPSCTVIFLQQQCTAHASQRRSPPHGWISPPCLYSPHCVHMSVLMVMW